MFRPAAAVFLAVPMSWFTNVPVYGALVEATMAVHSFASGLGLDTGTNVSCAAQVPSHPDILLSALKALLRLGCTARAKGASIGVNDVKHIWHYCGPLFESQKTRHT